LDGLALALGNEQTHNVAANDGNASSTDSPPADFVGKGEHIKKLLELAQRSGTTREAIIEDWNTWVHIQRVRDREFRLKLIDFRGDAASWKLTPLWGKRPGDLNPGSDDDRLRLRHIDWSGADISYARLNSADLDHAVLSSASLMFANLENAYLRYASLDKAILILANFRRADLWGTILKNADLTGANFKNAKLTDTSLEGACLSAADFEDAGFSRVVLKGADLRMVRFRNTTGLSRIDWRGRDLTKTSFSYCDLSQGDFTGAILRKVDFTQADVSNITYQKYRGITWIPFWPFRQNLMLGRYLGIRGVESCYGNPEFRRDALDQDFVDAKYESVRILQEVSGIETKRFVPPFTSFPLTAFRSVRWKQLFQRVPRRVTFGLWALSDYGRSAASIFFFAGAIILLFGSLYRYVLIPHHDVVLGATLIAQPHLPYREMFAAAMGAATLGVADLVYPETWIGEVVMLGNVLSGLMMFGMLIAVMQNKFARRA
jgi:uncharacterized protein YjbI with pentapeptide repeats